VIKEGHSDEDSDEEKKSLHIERILDLLLIFLNKWEGSHLKNPGPLVMVCLKSLNITVLLKHIFLLQVLLQLLKEKGIQHLADEGDLVG
jgi:hypothetical protein